MGRGVGKIVKRVYKLVKSPSGKKVRRYVGIDAKGRWKFLKTPKGGGGGGRSKRSTKSSPKKSKRNPNRGGVGKTTRRRSWLRTSRTVLQMGAFFAPAAATALRTDLDGRTKVVDAFRKYSGYNMDSGQFEWSWLAEGWMPYIATRLVSEGVAKLFGILRGLK